LPVNHCEHHGPDPPCGHGHLAEFEPGWRLIRMELKAHLPFTVAVSILTLVGAYLVAANVEFRGNPAPAGSDQHVAGHELRHSREEGSGHDHGQTSQGAHLFLSLFHFAHPTHVLFSAAATTTMFLVWQGGRMLTAALLGLIGSLGICSISDILIPWVGGALLGTSPHLHLCIVEHPLYEVPAAMIGVVAGTLVSRRAWRSTLFSHSGHVLISTLATVFYLLPSVADAYGGGYAMLAPGLAVAVLATVVLAVMLPCCISDVVFPLLFVRHADGSSYSPLVLKRETLHPERTI
jgi:hypothetical protein